MIHFFVGRPRNGKSLLVTKKILELLVSTRMFFVVNMALRLDEMQYYLDRRGHKIHVRDRVLILTEQDQMKHFWLYRNHGVVLKKPEGYDEKNGPNVDYTQIMEDPRFFVERQTEDGLVRDFQGTCYGIDECHTLWPARGWQGTPRHADFYLSQHAKLNDMCLFVTQNTKLVDPNFYRLAQDFTYCVNGRLQKFGRFRGANKFVATTYQNPVMINGAEPSMNVLEYSLDLEVAKCYDTSAGVGMPGGGTADVGFRVPGISLKWVWVVIGLAIAGVYVFFNYVMPDVTNKYLKGAVKGGNLQGRTRPGGPGVTPQTVHVPFGSPVNQNASPGVNKEPEVYVDAFLFSNKNYYALLSDGREVGRSEVALWASDGIKLRTGEVYKLKPRSRYGIPARTIPGETVKSPATP